MKAWQLSSVVGAMAVMCVAAGWQIAGTQQIAVPPTMATPPMAMVVAKFTAASANDLAVVGSSGITAV